MLMLTSKGQLVILVESPYVSVAQRAINMVDCSAVRLAAEAEISDIIAGYPDAETTGVPIEYIAEKAGANPIKLGAYLVTSIFDSN